jgi:hypothetical protein
MTPEEIEDLRGLIDRRRPPRDGMEIHFLRVLEGTARAASAKEKEWLQWVLDNKADAPQSRSDADRISDGVELGIVGSSMHGGQRHDIDKATSTEVAVLAPNPEPGRTRKLTPEQAEWGNLCSLASRAAQGDGVTERSVRDEFSRLIKKRNPLALRAQKELIESEKNNPYRKASPGFAEGAVLFHPFSEELPFLRG